MIKVKNIPVYYLNPDSFQDRRKMMDEFLTNLNLNFERVPSNSTNPIRQIRISEGFIKAVDLGIKRNNYPFLILEDDARLIKELPETINICKEVKLIYWGASTWECGGMKPNLSISEYNDDYYRLYGSLGCHAILIINKEAADHFIDINKKAIEKGEHCDIYFAIESQKELYVTPKDGPYFYQNDAHTEPITKFLWNELQKKYYK